MNQKYDTIPEENKFLQTELAELRAVLETQKAMIEANVDSEKQPHQKNENLLNVNN